MNIYLLTVILAIVLVAIVVLLLVRRNLDNMQSGDRSTPPASPRAAPPPPSPSPAQPEHPGGITAAAAAVADMTATMVGIDSADGEPDDLTRLKGLGPKAAAQLKLLGITRYVQLASLDSGQLASLDEKMGVFRGRIERDRWIEQARYLARGDTASFEAEFGKLG